MSKKKVWKMTAWIGVTYPYEGSTDKDEQAEKIARKYRALELGRGCTLIKPMVRDIDWEVRVENLKKMAAALKAAGFKVELG